MERALLGVIPLDPSVSRRRTVPQISERRTRIASLVPVEIVGIDRLYELLYASGCYKTWRTRGRVVTHAEFANLLHGDSSFGVVHTASGKTCGFVGIFGLEAGSRGDGNTVR